MNTFIIVVSPLDGISLPKFFFKFSHFGFFNINSSKHTQQIVNNIKIALRTLPSFFLFGITSTRSQFLKISYKSLISYTMY